MNDQVTERPRLKAPEGRKLKVLFLQPKDPKSYWGIDYLQPYISYKSPQPTLGILTLAGVITPECDVEIRDENCRPIQYETDADIVAISAQYLHKVHVARVIELATYFRNMGKLICIGGPVANLTPEAVRPYCDVLFEGEGELTWPQFLQDIKNGDYKDNYVQEEKFNMADAPIPRIDLINAKDYGSGIIQTTRGCPFSCEFCDIIVVFGRKVRMKPIENVIKEIEQWVAAGQHNIFFCDDNFVGNRVYCKKLLKELIKFNENRKYPVCYFTQASLDTAKDEELMELLRDANFAGIFIGIESPRKSSLTETLKFQNVHTADILGALKKIQSYGLWIAGGMIVGFDNDDKDIFEEQYNFIQEAGIVRAQIGLLHAVPKTPLYDRIKADGRLIEDQEGLEFNINPAAMTYGELITGYKKLMQRSYSYDAYCERYLNNLRNMGKHTFWGDRPVPDPRDLKAMLSMIRFYCFSGDLQRLRFFMKMMIGTLKINPRGWKWAFRYIGNYIHIQKYVELDVMPMKADLEIKSVAPRSLPVVAVTDVKIETSSPAATDSSHESMQQSAQLEELKAS